jgi:hypothetical protein
MNSVTPASKYHTVSRRKIVNHNMPQVAKEHTRTSNSCTSTTKYCSVSLQDAVHHSVHHIMKNTFSSI